ncbi:MULTISPECIES: nucleotide disphospho-sugar-binding domain-containing protein [unclassified Nocardia]|uniref:glycosyltransferase n=1 Tax=unclassified Nocardia TaxID=2637762 RepID=UPI00343508DF
MSRFLFVVPPLAGHINPTAAISVELAERGHEVAWVGHRVALEPLLPAGTRIFPVADAVSEERLRAFHERWLRLRGIAELKFFWEEFLIPLGHVMLPAVGAAIDTFVPDVIVSDQQALSGALAARRAGLPWATSVTTSSELTRPLAAMPKVESWVIECMAAFQRAHGVTDPVDLRWSDYLVMIYSTTALIGRRDGIPGHFVFPGPVLNTTLRDVAFPWDWLDPVRRTVLASLGTLNAGAGGRFFRTLVDAVADEADRLQLIIAAPPALIGSVPPHVLVREYVPQLSLLAKVDAVVCHGGHNTVCEALAHGLPVVVAPIRDDQPVVAAQIECAGAGVQVRFAHVRTPELREAIRAVLDNPAYRSAARQVQASFEAAGGAVAAADHLAKLADRSLAQARHGGNHG